MAPRRHFSRIQTRDWAWAAIAGLCGAVGAWVSLLVAADPSLAEVFAFTGLAGAFAFVGALAGMSLLAHGPSQQGAFPSGLRDIDQGVDVGYALADQIWASWIRDEMDHAGYNVHLQPWDSAEQYLSPHTLVHRTGERYALVLLSSALLSWHRYYTSRPVSGRVESGRDERLILVRVNGAASDLHVVAELGIQVTLDLTGLDADQSRAALHSTLELHGLGSPQRRDGPTTPFAFPGRRPDIDNLPARNPDFTGRESLLERLNESFKVPARPGPNACALYGMGGVGKSELVLEYAHRYRSRYDVIWWVSATSQASVANSLQELARRLELAEVSEGEKPLDALWDVLRARKRWLLIFDNAEEPDDLIPYWPPEGGGHVLVTSRTGNWMYFADECVPVDVPTPEESAGMLCRWSTDPDRDSARLVSAELGNLPLALAQAAAYVGETHISLARYLVQFQTRREDLLALGRPRGYANTVMTTWSISIDRAEQLSPGARDLIALLSFFTSGDIPIALLAASPHDLPPPLARVIVDDPDYTRTLQALATYSLLSIRDAGVHVHHLVQLAVRSGLVTDQQAHWAETAVRLSEAAFPQEVTNTAMWPDCARLLPHTLTASEMAQSVQVAPAVTATLLHRVAGYLYGQATFGHAKELYERALTIRGSLGGSTALIVAETQLALAQAHFRLAELETARALTTRALAVREEICGESDPLVAECLAQLGRIVLELSDLEAAYQYTKRALTMSENPPGRDERKLAEYYNDHGIVLWRRGHLGAAVRLHERALQIMETWYGPHDRKVADCCEYLGILHRDLKEYNAAKRYLNRGVTIRTNLFGPDHLTTQKLIVHLADVHRLTQEPAVARSLLEHALRIRIAGCVRIIPIWRTA